MTRPGSATLTPTAPEERIEVLDVLRGFALLGILMVNMAFYSQPIVVPFLGEPAGARAIDRAASLFIRFFAEGKFYSLFSLLFGIGLFVQMTRVEARGGAFGALYARRLLVLLAIGVAHALFIWPGDILATYALLGFILLAFRKRKPKTLAVWAVGLVVVPLVLAVVSMVVIHLVRGQAHDAAALAAAQSQRMTRWAGLAAQEWQAYRQGSFLEVTRQRARDVVLLLPSLVRMVPGILCMFVSGLWVARRGLLHDVAANRRLLVRIISVCLPLGLIANALLVLAHNRGAGGPGGWFLAGYAAVAIGGPLLCFAYASGLALLVAGEPWRQRLAPLGAAGRMALTNYLLQSLVCTTLFYGYGVGLLGRLGAAAGLALALALWAAQLGLSVLWLRHFRYGPAEWLWRSLTYLRAQPMRRGQAGALAAHTAGRPSAP